MTQATTLAKIDAFRVDVASIGTGSTAPPPPPGSTIVKLGLNYTKAGLLPFGYGQYFKRGDVPKGSTIVADCAKFQCVPWSYFDDGSVCFAHVAGYCNVTAPARVDVAMRLGVPAAAAPFVGKPQAQVDIHVSIDGVEPPITSVKVIASGPFMLHEEVTRKHDAHVSVVYEVKQFANGEGEILQPAIENRGFLDTVQPNRLLLVKVVVGGATLFNSQVTVVHHSTPIAMNGSQWSIWIGGGDPGLFPTHDALYARLCEALPPVTVGPASSLPYMRQTYVPNYPGENGPGMSGGGWSPHIGPLARHNWYYLTTGGPLAWNYLWAESCAVGSWPIHLKDEATGEPPLPTQYPKHTSRDNTIPRSSIGEGALSGYDSSHHPSSTYVLAIVTGWNRFVRFHLAWATWLHFNQQPPVRLNEQGIIRSDAGSNQVRGSGWTFRTYAQWLALSSPAHPHHTEFVKIWQNNMAWLKGRFVTGTVDGGKYVNNLGIFAPYTSDGSAPFSAYKGFERGTSKGWWDAAWMHAICGGALGLALYMRLPVGAQAQADNAAVFQHAAKLIVGLCGDGGPTAYNYRRFGCYAFPVGPDGDQRPPITFYADLGQCFAEHIKAKNLLPLSAALGGTLKQHDVERDFLSNGWDWAAGFASYYWPLMVFAVIHQAPGAAAALARLMSSPSFAYIQWARNDPTWAGMMPPGVKHPGAA